MRRFALAMALSLAATTALSAERLMLRDGSSVYGRFISGNSRSVIFEDSNGARRTYPTSDIQVLDFQQTRGNGSANRDSGYRDQSSYQNSNRDQSYGYQNSDRDRSYADRNGSSYRDANGRQWSDWTTLPAGTKISVRTDQEITSDNATPGTTFPALIVEDVRSDSGSVVIPRGAEANLIIREAREGGTLSGGRFALDLDSVRVNGHQYFVNTEDLQKGDRGIGANRRTGEYVGGGAALGTLLGALAGGGKGAAIGAIAGAVAGGGVQVLTKGDRIRVPAETVLNFRLDEPVRLREPR